jgi:excinuclease UvrABC ATPase subunit
MEKNKDIKNLQEAFENMRIKYKETKNEIYKTLMKEIQNRLNELGE